MLHLIIQSTKKWSSTNRTYFSSSVEPTRLTLGKKLNYTSTVPHYSDRSVLARFS